MKVLASLPQLIHCTLKAVVPTGALQRSLVLAPRLESLSLHTIGSQGSDATYHVLDHITAPALLNLTLDFKQDFHRALQHTRIISFIQRSSCKLEGLSIHGVIRRQELLEILCKVPSLVEFAIDFTNSFLLYPTLDWSFNDISGICLPGLQVLRFSARQAEIINFNELVTLLESRRERSVYNGVDIAQLQVANIEVPCGTRVPGSAVKPLQNLRASGMELSMSCSGCPHPQTLLKLFSICEPRMS